MNTLEARAAAAEAGTLKSFRGEPRLQEFRSEMRSTLVTRDGKDWAKVEGYASTVNQPYVMYDMFGEYTETIDGNAFTKTLGSKPDVNFLVNHAGVSMARTTAGTLELNVDEHGLHQVAYLNPQRSDVQLLLYALEDKSLDQMSFAFRIVDGAWSPDYTQFTILELDLDRGDVSAVNYGANPYTSIAARAGQISARQVDDIVGDLSGAALRILAERAQERLAATAPADEVAERLAAHVEEVAEPEPAPVKRGPNIRTLRSLLELDEL